MIQHFRGNSGCMVYSEGDKVVKVSPSLEYNERLHQSHNKMVSDPCNGYRVPKSTLITESGSVSRIEMDYVGGESVVEFLMKDPFGNGDWLAEKLIQLLERGSTPLMVDFELIKNKLESIGHCTSFLEGMEGHIELTSGFCHGDLTFSNMKVWDGELWLFDHLDSYIESPVMDMVKVFQDTDHLWSLRYYTGPVHPDYYKAMTFIRNRLLFEFPIQRYTLNLLQMVNLSRILPYAKDESLKEELAFHIGGLV